MLKSNKIQAENEKIISDMEGKNALILREKEEIDAKLKKITKEFEAKIENKDNLINLNQNKI